MSISIEPKKAVILNRVFCVQSFAGQARILARKVEIKRALAGLTVADRKGLMNVSRSIGF